MSKAKGQEPDRAGVANDLDKLGRSDLSEKKQLAIDLLLIGTKLQDVAKTVGISREQLWRWRTQDQSFSAGLERRRTELYQSHVDQFWGSLVPLALQVTAESLAEGDPEMARDVLRLAARGLTDLRIVDSQPLAKDQT